MGCTTAGGRTLTFTSAEAVRAFLPAGSKPGVLAASATNPTSTAAGVFAGQVLALQLNVTLSNSGDLAPGLASFVLKSGPAAGKTVAQVLADANKALGGCGLPPYASTIAQLNDIVDAINKACYAVTTNLAPVVDAGADQTVTLPAPATLTGGATDDGLPDPPKALTYQWSQVSGPAPATLATPTQPSTLVSFTAAGVHEFRLTVSDSALSGSATLRVTVNPAANTPPIVSAGADQTITLPAAAALAGSVTDDGLPPPAALSVAWSQDAGPAPALLAQPTQAATSSSFLTPGTYVLRLTASDGALSASATTQITVLDGAPSLGSIPDRTLPVGTRFSVRLSANDPNLRDTLGYFLDEAPDGAEFDPNPVVVWTPSAAQLGVNIFTARVVDAAGTSDSKTFRITVTPANHAPQLGAQADARVPAGGRFTRLLTATDPDPGDTLTFSLVSGPPGLLLAGDQLSWNPAASEAGTYSVTVAVTDDAGLVDSARFKLSVVATSAPVARNDAYEVALGQTLSVAGPGVLANDIDPDGGALTASGLSDPDKGTLSGPDADGGFSYTAPPFPPGPLLDVRRALEWSSGAGIEVGIAPPLVVDVTGDGTPEILSFEFNGDMHVIRGDTGALLFHVGGLPAAQTGGLACALYGIGNATYAAADIDDDGRVEIVLPAQCGGDAGPFFAAGAANRVVAIVHDASQPEGYRVKWLTPVLPDDASATLTSGNSFAIARLRPDERPSVLFGKTFQGSGNCAKVRGAFADVACRVVFALNGNDGSIGRIYYSAPEDPASVQGYANASANSIGGFMAPVVADVDDDGLLEVLFEGALWTVDGPLKRQFDGTASSGSATLSSAVVDLDGDAPMEIVTLDPYGVFGMGFLKARKADGRLLWSVGIPRTTVPTKLTIADVDRDGRPEIIFGLYNSIWVVDHAGRIKWARSMGGAADGGSFSFFVGGGVSFPVYDLNGDGIPEMVVQYGKETIRFLRADNGEDQVSWTYPGTTYSNTQSPMTPVVADVDGSGRASVIWYHDVNLNGRSFLQVLRGDSVPWTSAPAHFNQAAYWETNFNADGSVPLAYPRHTATPRTNVFGQQPQAPYAPDFVPATATSFSYAAVNEAGLASSPASVDITIAPQNRPPAFTSKPPKFWASFVVDYFAHAVDPDLGDSVTYALVFKEGNNPNVSVNPTTGQVTLAGLFSGDQSIILSATDGRGGTGYQAFTMQQAAGTAPVPDVLGLTQAAAASALTSALLSVGETAERFDAAEPGTVIGQSPAAGTLLPHGESVDLSVSLGPTPVAIPSVVGGPSTAAVTLLAARGLSVTTTSTFSNTVAAGIVIAQSPAAGTLVAPTAANPVALTVSAGNGLGLALSRSVATADQTIVAIPSAFDLNGSPTALPPLSYTVEAKQAPFAGALPTLSGTTITFAPGTLGAFRVTATDAANGRSASADFAVLPPRVPGMVTNGEGYAHMAEVLDAIFALRQPLEAARAADDTALMIDLLRQIVTLWRTVDLDELRISQPLVTPDQFAPTIGMLAGSGLRPSPDDVISHQVLKDAIADLTAWTGVLNGGGTLASLEAAADQFSTRAARMDGLAISRYGGISNAPQYTRLMSHAIPAFYEALSEQLAVLTGLPPRPRRFAPAAAGNPSGAPAPGPQSPTALASAAQTRPVTAASGSLGELLVAQAVGYLVDKVMDEAAQTYKNAKQFAVDVMQQAAYTAVAVSVAAELRAHLQGEDAVVVSGASLSFREFQAAPGWIEASADEDPTVNVVLLIGPDLFSKITQAGTDFVKKLQDGYNRNLNPETNPNRYRNADQIKNDLWGFVSTVRQALGDVDAVVAQQAKLVFQSADASLNGCVFTSDPACRQLVYDNGFQPVYTYSPPPGFSSLGGLPVPIVFIVYNAANGAMSFGAPPFLPCSIDTSVTPNQVQCPNNPPFTP